MTLNIEQIKKIIPNRYPYLMIDKVTELEPGKSASGYKNLTANEWYFPVHFPEEPMMPGMIQMEALLQMVGVAVLSVDKYKGMILRGKSANHIRLKGHVVPGRRMDIIVEINQLENFSGISIAKAYIDEKEVCSAEFEFEIVDSGEN